MRGESNNNINTTTTTNNDNNDLKLEALRFVFVAFVMTSYPV